MQKIPTLFERDDSFRVVDEVNPDCQWVLDGEGIATRKWDGTACMIMGGRLYKRLNHKAKRGDPPARWVHWSMDPQQRSGHGWVPVGDSPEDRRHLRAATEGLRDGTYELCGPSVQKNPDHISHEVLIRHGAEQYPGCPRTYAGLREWLYIRDIEGVVFHHPDGRMAKIKGRDFGFVRPKQ